MNDIISKKSVELIINAGTLLCIDESDEVQSNKAIIVSGGVIIDILDINESKNKYISENIISAESQIVMPGFVNTHTHIPMVYLKGIADDLPLDIWLKEHIWPAEARCINPEYIYYASCHGIAEMIKCGITFFNDMYFIPVETAKACEAIGIRSILGNAIIDFSVGDFAKAEKSFDNLYETIEFTNRNPLVEISQSLHSVYTCSIDTWKKALEIAKKENILIHTHLSETLWEVEECKKKYHGMTPVKLLDSIEAFDTRLIFAHGVYLEDDDFDILKSKNISLSMNLHSNLKLASGILPIKKYIDNGINISVGTDGSASNNSLCINSEISTAAKLFKAIYKDAAFLTAKELVKMATINGAKALGYEKITGSIEIGKSADIICIDTDNFMCQPIYDPFSYIVYSMKSSDVSTVIISGKTVLLEKKLQTVNEDELLYNAKKYKEIVYDRKL